MQNDAIGFKFNRLSFRLSIKAGDPVTCGLMCSYAEQHQQTNLTPQSQRLGVTGTLYSLELPTATNVIAWGTSYL